MTNEKYVKNKIKELLGNFFQPLKDAKAIIAGGCLTSLYSNKEINDIDIYFRSREELKTVLTGVLDDSDEWITFYTKKSVSLALNNGTKVQLINYSYFDTPQSVFNDFDFTCCMCAYDLATDEIVMDPRFIYDLAKRVLMFNGGTKFPIKSLSRVDKYQKKGFTISSYNLMKIGTACTKLNIRDWDEFEDQFGGVYGMKLADNLPEFNIDIAINDLERFLVPDLEWANIDKIKKDFDIPKATVDYSPIFPF